MATHVYLVGDARVKPCLNPWAGLWDDLDEVHVVTDADAAAALANGADPPCPEDALR